MAGGRSTHATRSRLAAPENVSIVLKDSKRFKQLTTFLESERCCTADDSRYHFDQGPQASDTHLSENKIMLNVNARGGREVDMIDKESMDVDVQSSGAQQTGKLYFIYSRFIQN